MFRVPNGAMQITGGELSPTALLNDSPCVFQYPHAKQGVPAGATVACLEDVKPRNFQLCLRPDPLGTTHIFYCKPGQPIVSGIDIGPTG